MAHDQTEAFVSILEITALMLPIAFLGLVTEGARIQIHFTDEDLAKTARRLGSCPMGQSY